MTQVGHTGDGEVMDEFEKALKRLQPPEVRASEADVMYQCGWNAALASQGRQVQPQNVAKWVRPFLSGVSVTAACWLISIFVQASAANPNASDTTELASAQTSDLLQNSAANSGTKPAASADAEIESLVEGNSDVEFVVDSLRSVFSSLAMRIPDSSSANPILLEKPIVNRNRAQIPKAQVEVPDSISLFSSRNAAVVTGILGHN